MKSTALSFLFLLFSTCTVYAQNECQYYHKKACGDKDNYPMKYDSQSKSAILGKGQISEFHMVAYNGLDYRINVCAEEILGTQIQFKIYEKKRELIRHEEEEYVEETQEATTSASDVEYSDDGYSDDYSSEDYSEDYSDSYDDAYSDDLSTGESNKPKFRLVKELLYDNASDSYSNQLEFTADGSMSLIIEVSVPGEDNKSKLKIRDMGCVGVLIEHIKSRQAGFH